MHRTRARAPHMHQHIHTYKIHGTDQAPGWGRVSDTHPTVSERRPRDCKTVAMSPHFHMVYMILQHDTLRTKIRTYGHTIIQSDAV